MQDNGAAPNGLTFDNDKALKVSKELHAARKEKRGVFIKGVRAPEDVLPNRMVRGSREHALYLFHSAPLTPRARSEDMYHWLRRLYETKPEMFDPEHVRSLSMAEVSKSIKSFLPHGDADVAMWCENSLKLENYGDNPVNICGDERDVALPIK